MLNRSFRLGQLDASCEIRHILDAVAPGHAALLTLADGRCVAVVAEEDYDRLESVVGHGSALAGCDAPALPLGRPAVRGSWLIRPPGAEGLVEVEVIATSPEHWQAIAESAGPAWSSRVFGPLLLAVRTRF